MTCPGCRGCEGSPRVCPSQDNIMLSLRVVRGQVRMQSTVGICPIIGNVLDTESWSTTGRFSMFLLAFVFEFLVESLILEPKISKNIQKYPKIKIDLKVHNLCICWAFPENGGRSPCYFEKPPSGPKSEPGLAVEYLGLIYLFFFDSS